MRTIKTERGAKIVVGRAVRQFTPADGNTANVYMTDDGRLFLQTRAMGGDNVPWAMSLFIKAAKALTGWKIESHQKIDHCCGSVSGYLVRV